MSHTQLKKYKHSLTFTEVRKGPKGVFFIMKKSKLFKTISFSSLALIMGIAGTMAFAPLGAAPLASASTIDQINTKADGENIKYAPSALGLDPENDPVIYTTESGLEIKFGGESVNNSLPSGALSGYPYFTMGTYDGYAVNWVIIGRNTNDTVFTSAITNYLFSNWKTTTNIKSSPFPTKGYYFFNNTYETTTPAGSAINGVVPSKSYVADVTKATKSVVANAEVPSGCVLAISECCLGYSYYNCTSSASSKYDATGSQNYGSRYRYISTSGSSDTQGVTFSYSTNPGTLYSYINNLYDTNLGLTTTQKNMIQSQKLMTAYVNGATAYLDTYDTDGNTLYKLFPLAGFKQGSYWADSNNPGDENFIISTYLNSAALRKAYQIGATTSITYWLRGSEPTYSASARGVGDTGSNVQGEIYGNWARYNFGVRPAGVFKLG